MKPIIVSSIMLLGGFAGAAMADCTTNPPLTGRALSAAITNKLVCGRPGANYPGGVSSPDRWQEEHPLTSGQFTSGPLIDYKLGPTNTVDPRKQVGTWSFDTTDPLTVTKITHSYSAGAPFIYTWDVRLAAAPNKYSFCKGSEEHVVAFIVPNGGAGCGGVYP
jgi:hypothetical protein